MKTFTVYAAEHEDKNNSYTVDYSFDLVDLAEKALVGYQKMSSRDQKETEVWIYGYECTEEETDLSDAEKTYKTILDADLEEKGCLRECVAAEKLNDLSVKYFGCGSFTVRDRFGNSLDISVSEYSNAYYDDEYEAIDALYDDLAEKLIFDKQTIRDSADLAVIENEISCTFDV